MKMKTRTDLILLNLLIFCNGVLSDEENDQEIITDTDFTGFGLTDVPTEILGRHKKIVTISLNNNEIRKIRNDSFPKEACKDVIFISLHQNLIDEIDENAFRHMPKLIEVHFSRNRLTKIPKLNIPSLTKLIMSENEIKAVSVDTFSYLTSLEHLDLRHNSIEKIHGNTFIENPKIIWMAFSNNPLHTLDENAFKGLNSLEILRLENTKIDKLPHKYGIEKIKKLYLKNTPNLFTIPYPEKFKKIREVELTYPYHCCAFRGTRKQDSNFNSSKPCNTSDLTPTTTTTTPSQKERRYDNENDTMMWIDDPDMKDLFEDLLNSFNQKPDDISPCTSVGDLVPGPPVDGHFKITCTPEPDAFNPCENVMGTAVLRAFSWIISIFAVLGNVFQLVILFYNKEELTVYKLLMYNLGLSNLMMGVYLIILCCVDARTYGEYYNFVWFWQYNGGCQVAGFIAMFATQLSVCSLVMITVERFLLIIYALHVEKQMKLHHAKIGVSISWLYSFLVALMPAAIGINSYNKTAICLPLDLSNVLSIGYLVWVLLAYIIAFLAILACYISIYRSINEARPGTATRSIEIQVAKRMSMIIFSNFFCWLPISFAGFMALFTGLDFDVNVAKFLLVFFFPLNACTNPFLYAIFTKVFREDTLNLLSSCGLIHLVDDDNQRGRAPSLFKVKKNRSNTNTKHFMHLQAPTTNYVNAEQGNMETQTELGSPETPLKVLSSKPKVDKVSDSDGKPRSDSTRPLLGNDRMRAESSGASSTGQSAISEDDDFSKMIGSIQKNNGSILRI